MRQTANITGKLVGFGLLCLAVAVALGLLSPLAAPTFWNGKGYGVVEPETLKLKATRTPSGERKIIPVAEKRLPPSKLEPQVQPENLAEQGKVEGYLMLLRSHVNSDKPLAMWIRMLGRTRDRRSLAILKEILKKNPRASNRAAACNALALVEEYHKDTSALADLREALNDPSVDVRLRAAICLVRLGRPDGTLGVLQEVAEGRGVESWPLDWETYLGTLDSTSQEARQNQVKFKDGMRKYAINCLASIGTDECMSILERLVRERGEDRLSWGDTTISLAEYLREIRALEGALKGLRPPLW